MPEIIERVTCDNNEWIIEDEGSKFISGDRFFKKEARTKSSRNFFNEELVQHAVYLRLMNETKDVQCSFQQKGPLIRFPNYLKENKYDDVLEYSGDYTLPFEIEDIHKSFINFISLNPLECPNNESHTHTMGGDDFMWVEDIVDRFYEDANIQCIYVQQEGNYIHLTLVLFDDEIDQLALGLAKLQNEVSREYPDYSIEIDYLPAKYFSSDLLPDGAVSYSRR